MFSSKSDFSNEIKSNINEFISILNKHKISNENLNLSLNTSKNNIKSEISLSNISENLNIQNETFHLSNKNEIFSHLNSNNNTINDDFFKISTSESLRLSQNSNFNVNTSNNNILVNKKVSIFDTFNKNLLKSFNLN